MYNSYKIFLEWPVEESCKNVVGKFVNYLGGMKIKHNFFDHTNIGLVVFVHILRDLLIVNFQLYMPDNFHLLYNKAYVINPQLKKAAVAASNSCEKKNPVIIKKICTK